jgi:hypothetical protein
MSDPYADAGMDNPPEPASDILKQMQREQIELLQQRVEELEWTLLQAERDRCAKLDKIPAYEHDDLHIASWKLGWNTFHDAVRRKTMSAEPITEEPIIQFFAHSHLPEHLQEVSRPFAQLANVLTSTLPRNPERTVALRKLLEAKDAAVRARLFK